MSEHQPEGIWCLVANVAPEQVYGQEHTVRLGTKHFSPNTKVYCFPPAWGDGYAQIRVIGRHRGSARLVTLIMRSHRLINWRVNYVRQPYFVCHMEPGWTKEQAEKMLASLLLNLEAEQARQHGSHTVAPDKHILYTARFGLNDEIQAACAREASPNAQWRTRWTPLLLATTYGHVQTVTLLVELGTDVDFANEYEETVLACAKFMRHNEIIRILDQTRTPA